VLDLQKVPLQGSYSVPAVSALVFYCNVKVNASPGFELFNPALHGIHDPDHVEGSKRLESLKALTWNYEGSLKIRPDEVIIKPLAIFIMEVKMPSNEIGRRRFIQALSSAFVGLGTSRLFKAGSSFATPEKKPNVEYRTLGKTGLKVTAVSMGVMNCSDPTVPLRAFELGINFYDTADCYMGGRNEEMVGKVFEGKRQQVVLQTKVHDGEEKKMRASVERSLRRLRTDYIDVLLWHNFNSTKEVSNPRLFEFMTKMKKEGKARFTGFSSHSNMASLLIEASKSSTHDMALVSYNFTHSKGLREAVGLAAKSGMGIVAMKTQAGGYKKEKMKGLNPHQAALRYVLMDQNVSCAVPGVTTVEEIEECATVMRTMVTGQNIEELKRYHGFLRGRICTFCGGCSGECPHGVSHQDLLRVVMYHDGYEEDRLIREALEEKRIGQNIQICSSCSSCSVVCRKGLDVKEQIQMAQTIIDQSRGNS
jgi:aryl-alcohol dehydrogenase-like predicted oxidoreductase